MLHGKICRLIHGKEPPEPTHNENLTTMIPLKDFTTYLINQPVATVKGNYGKSIELLGKNSAVVLAPICDLKARMVENRRYKKRPILTRKGSKRDNIGVKKIVLIFKAMNLLPYSYCSAEKWKIA